MNNVAYQLLQGLKPHPKDGTKFCEAVYVTWEVVLAVVDKMFNQLLSKVVAVPAEWVVIVAVPEITKLPNNVVHFVLCVVCDSDGNALLERETSRVASLDDDDARGGEVVASI